jgi:hypothetical protein
MKTVLFLEIETQDGANVMDILNYVADAIESHGGSLSPDDPMFGHQRVLCVVEPRTGLRLFKAE